MLLKSVISRSRSETATGGNDVFRSHSPQHGKVCSPYCPSAATATDGRPHFSSPHNMPPDCPLSMVKFINGVWCAAGVLALACGCSGSPGHDVWTLNGSVPDAHRAADRIIRQRLRTVHRKIQHMGRCPKPVHRLMRSIRRPIRPTARSRGAVVTAS